MNAAVIALHFPLNNFTSPQEPVLLLISPLIICFNYCHLFSNSLTPESLALGPRE